MPSLSLSLSLSLSVFASRALSSRSPCLCRLCVASSVASCRLECQKKRRTGTALFSSDNSAHITESTVVFPCSTPHRSAIKNTGTILDRSIEIFPPLGLGGGEARAHTSGNAVGRAATTRAERRRRREDLRRRDLCASAFTAAPRGPGETPRALALERERGGGGGSVLRPDKDDNDDGREGGG